MNIIVIPAKGGSTRLPNKNMAPLNGRPMIDYSIDQALASKLTDAIYVSTDSDAIEAHARSRNLQVIRRPESLGGDTFMIEVMRHAISTIDDPNIAVLVCLQPDHPDRAISVDESLEVFKRENVDKVFSTEADGTKNGAHYVLSRHYLDTDECRTEFGVIDDCTNVHYQADLDKAAANLKK